MGVRRVFMERSSYLNSLAPCGRPLVLLLRYFVNLHNYSPYNCFARKKDDYCNFKCPTSFNVKITRWSPLTRSIVIEVLAQGKKKSRSSPIASDA